MANPVDRAAKAVSRLIGRPIALGRVWDTPPLDGHPLLGISRDEAERAAEQNIEDPVGREMLMKVWAELNGQLEDGDE